MWLMKGQVVESSGRLFPYASCVCIVVVVVEKVGAGGLRGG